MDYDGLLQPVGATLGDVRAEVGEVYGLTPADVRWALAYENARQAA